MSKTNKFEIYVGHFGSGKTEIAINRSIELAKRGEKVILVDLDIVNPFFRVAELKNRLEQANVTVIAPPFAASNVDLPVLSAEIYRIFAEKDCRIILDIGGDEDGAIVLGRYANYFNNENCLMNFVVNTCRPFTDTKEKILLMIQEIQKSSRLSVSSIINNSNLAYETTIEQVVNGQKICEEVGGKTGLEVSKIVVESKLYDALPEHYKSKAYRIKRYMKPMWE